MEHLHEDNRPYEGDVQKKGRTSKEVCRRVCNFLKKNITYEANIMFYQQPRQLKQSYDEQGEKAGKLLAWRFKNSEAERAISTIQTDKGLETSNPKEMNKNLYNTDHTAPSIHKQEEFLDSLAVLEVDLNAEEL